MSDFLSSIQGTAKSSHATGALYLIILGYILLDVLPNPLDPLAISSQIKLRDEWDKGEVSPNEYWRRSLLAMYGPDLLWAIILLIIVASVPGDAQRKLYTLLIVMGAGAAIAIMYRIYRKDLSEHPITSAQ